MGMENDKYLPNGNEEEVSMGILHSVGGFWVSNEGSSKDPMYHVWIPGITHCTCDSAYSDITLAVGRCNYLARTFPKVTNKKQKQ